MYVCVRACVVYVVCMCSLVIAVPQKTVQTGVKDLTSFLEMIILEILDRVTDSKCALKSSRLSYTFKSFLEELVKMNATFY